FNALNQGAPLSVHPLGRTWRSQPALLEFINAVSQTLFEDYQTLEAKGKPSKLDALHVLVTPDQPKTKSHPWRAERVASALKAKLEDPSYLITDRNTEEERRVRGGDCAVLCPTHSMLEHYAEALRKQGLRVRLQQSGWLESSELMITMEALSLLHDPQNLHARLYLSVTALGHHTLQDALKKLVAGETLVDPAFEKLLQLSESAGRATVDQIVPEALRVLGLYDAVTTWPDARQARANLLRLEGLAQEFVDAQPESLMAGGIHGYGLPQFMSWVRKRAESDNDMPAASVVDDNAIELVTWHACKGREWPIVAVCGMSQHVKARVPDLQLGYPHFDDLDQLIESAAIEFSPAFASPQASKRFLARLTPDREDQIRREIYVALTRPRDQLLLEWPLDAVSSESTTRASLLQDRAHIQINEVSVSVADVVELPAIIEHASLEPSPLCPIDAERAPSHGRRALRIRTYSGTSTPDSRSPSSGHDQAINDNLGQWDELKYAEPLDLPPHSDPLAVGEFVHRYFELDFDSQRVSQHLRDQAYKLWPNQAEWVCERLKIARKNFEVAIDAKFTPTSQAAEVPVIGMDHKGSVLNGIIDLLLHTSSGQVVIDHKTDRAAEMAVLVNRHAMQLEDYALMLGEGAVQALVIHAASAGRILIRHIA
ncbi:MAG: PD-(D/E)XK nuclease family protein, partial [Oceanococcus sp.]